MRYNYLCVIISGPDKKGNLVPLPLSGTDSLISLMCRINIILSDIPELLEVCVAVAMIQSCQGERTHQSNSICTLARLTFSHEIGEGVHKEFKRACMCFGTLV